jgi:hypothetical protein
LGQIDVANLEELKKFIDFFKENRGIKWVYGTQ